MSDLKLVAPDQPTPFERMLLDAVANEAPSAEQRLRVRQALGLPALSIAPPPVAAVGRRGLLVKVVAGGLIASAALLLVLVGAGRKATPLNLTPAPQTVAAPSVSPPAPAAAAEPVASPLPPVELVPEPTRSGRRSGRSRGAVASSGAEVGTDLSEQLRLIEAARAAVAAGNGALASAAIASYRRQFPRGSFGQEATVLQIEAVDLRGNHAQAAALARTFLAQHPNSPHVGLMQRIADRSR